MSSNIDPTHPEDEVPVSKASQRANWLAVRTEMEHGGFFTPSGVGASQDTVASRLDRTVYAREFGVLGDGGDYTDELQAALDAAEGKTLFVEGSSRVTRNLRIQSNCRIVGIGGATLKFPLDFRQFGAGEMLTIDSVENIVIENLEIDGEYSDAVFYKKASHAIHIEKSRRIVIKCCFIHDLPGANNSSQFGSGIDIRESVDIWLVRNKIHNVQRNSIGVWGPTGTENRQIFVLENSLSVARVRNLILVSSGVISADSPRLPDWDSSAEAGNVIISNNFLSHATTWAALRLSGAYDSIIANNWFRGNIWGIRMMQMTKHKSVIIGNLFEKSQECHIKLLANSLLPSSISITNNVMDGAGIKAISLEPGLNFPEGSERTTIDVRGNTLLNGCDIDLESPPEIGGQSFRVSIQNNSFFDPHHIALRIAGIDRPMVTGNRFEGDAQAAIKIVNSDKAMVKDNQLSGIWREAPLVFDGLSNEIVRDNRI